MKMGFVDEIDYSKIFYAFEHISLSKNGLRQIVDERFVSR